MEFLRKCLILSETPDKLRRIGLKQLNLLGSGSLYKYNSPKQTFSKKRLNKKIIFDINSPQPKIRSKVKSRSTIDNFSSSVSLTKDTKLSPLNAKNMQNYKQNFFKKTLLISNNMNIYTPNIKGFQRREKNDLYKIKDRNSSTVKLLKNSFSISKMTNSKSALSFNFNLDKMPDSIKSRGINLIKSIENASINKNKELLENNKLYDNEKIMFKNKFIRKKIDENRQNILYKSRKKYPFVKSSEVINIKESNIIPESINKINKKEQTILLNESKGVFQHPINIIKKGRFSKKFENPWNYSLEPEKKPSFEIKEIPLGEYILNYEENKKENKKKDKKYDRKELFFKIKKVLLQIKLIDKNLKIPFSQIIKSYKIPNSFINFDRTHLLNYYIKIGDFSQAKYIISIDQDIVIGLDHFGMTPLHYAAKYNFYQIIPQLMEYGAYVDAKNAFGITPLFLCIQRNFYESIILLILFMANPFINLEKNRRLIENGSRKLEFYTKNICKRVKEIYFRNIYGGAKNLYESIQSDILKFVKNECQDFLETDCYNLIKLIFRLD
jgi:hypothetical protein